MEIKQTIRIGIDASNIGGGGGITHLKEVLNAYDLDCFENQIAEIIVFGSQKTLNELPRLDRLVKKTFSPLNKGIFNRIIFQIFKYDQEIKKHNIDILLSLTGDYIGNFKPVIGMSRNMLLYEWDIWKEIKSLKEILRFWLNYKKQKICFKNAVGIIFISNYAKVLISSKLQLKNKEISIINHGISPNFVRNKKEQQHISNYSFSNPYKFLYVSTIHVYKHQWNVIKAIGILRAQGYPVALNLIGGVLYKPSENLLKKTLRDVDPKGEFIKYFGSIDYEKVQNFYKDTDGIIFASTCENMPNILLESMASASPIACSNKQPMPEFLKENGFYFDSYNVNSIVVCLEKLLIDIEKRNETITNNLLEITKYSWEKTSKHTFQKIIKNYKNYKNV